MKNSLKDIILRSEIKGSLAGLIAGVALYSYANRELKKTLKRINENHKNKVYPNGNQPNEEA